MCLLVAVRFCISSIRRHTRCALVTGVQTCALPICVAPTAELVPPDPIADWRNVISAADKMRLEGLEAAWTDAPAEARKAGYTKAVKAEGALLEPDAAQIGRAHV